MWWASLNHLCSLLRLLYHMQFSWQKGTSYMQMDFAHSALPVESLFALLVELPGPWTNQRPFLFIFFASCFILFLVFKHRGVAFPSLGFAASHSQPLFRPKSFFSNVVQASHVALIPPPVTHLLDKFPWVSRTLSITFLLNVSNTRRFP